MVALLAFTASVAPLHIPFSQEWEETQLAQIEPTYHPFIQFQGGNKFAWMPPQAPPTYGVFAVEGTHYTFTPQCVVELNQADIDKLTADGFLDEAFKGAQARALAPFEGDYDPENKVLTVRLPFNHDFYAYALHDYTEGDDALPDNLSAEERPILGLWRGIDQHPDRYDTKTRFRWQGIDGLKSFFGEALQAGSAAFDLLDFRRDKTVRNHRQTLNWWKEGPAFKTLDVSTGERHSYAINEKGQLIEDGAVKYERP